ncbi:cytochrome c oxidase subunit 3 [Silanimonas sp.]|jgi:cytochrome c oxidase subunit 3|uniref:cytochrome c oxidase subunit 3 n=1 Tax=Silanimonas sp. TaxID=1929290 RepID=UPI0037C62583
MATAHHDADVYFVPHHSKWPFVGSISLFVLMIGLINWFNGSDTSFWIFMAGIAMMIYTLFGWFGDVIRESEGGNYNGQVDISFRQGMIWFIFSEVMFFAAFFGALFYVRTFALPWISGEGHGGLANEFLWNGYVAGWPANGPEAIGGAFETLPAFGLPLINTVILLTSGLTLTIAHHAMVVGQRSKVLTWLGATILLGFCFFGVQAYEYIHAWGDLNLRISSGIYGATFYMLTGFHGLHVFLGTVMLLVVWFRVLKGHFTAEKHFGFEAVAWYWHFVDVVWLGLFLFVYVL